jgi:hypothetical protein
MWVKHQYQLNLLVVLQKNSKKLTINITQPVLEQRKTQEDLLFHSIFLRQIYQKLHLLKEVKLPSKSQIINHLLHLRKTNNYLLKAKHLCKKSKRYMNNSCDQVSKEINQEESWVSKESKFKMKDQCDKLGN